MSRFGGKLNEIEEISIDRFDGDNLRSTAFFLSHCHSDHMEGLDSKNFEEILCKRDDVYLYCSEISGCILKNDLRYSSLKRKIKELTTTQSHILTVPSLNDSRKEICVTLIPAGHCPGSVMFLFELPTGNVLFTGDFRVTMTDVKNLSQLHHRDGTPKEINTCYLDATFFDELYPSFPSREESLKKVCDLIKEWLTGDNSNEILLDSPARYGCEHIYVGINAAFGMKIHVQLDTFLKYRTILKIGSAITSNYDDTRIHACGKNENYCCRKPGAKWKIIRLSCMWFQKEHAAKEEIVQICPTYTRVCYACHSSYLEIVEFVKYLSPRKVAVFASPRGKPAHEVEEEIHNHLLKRKKEKNEERVDEVTKLWKKRRVFDVKEWQPNIPVSQFQLSEEWSLEENVPSNSHRDSPEKLEEVEVRGGVHSDSHCNSSEKLEDVEAREIVSSNSRHDSPEKLEEVEVGGVHSDSHCNSSEKLEDIEAKEIVPSNSHHNLSKTLEEVEVRGSLSSDSYHNSSEKLEEIEARGIVSSNSHHNLSKTSEEVEVRSVSSDSHQNSSEKLADIEARGIFTSDSHHNLSEASISENGEILGRDSEGSLSFLPQCHTPTDPIVSCQGKDDIEIITLSSDDSSEVIIIE